MICNWFAFESICDIPNWVTMILELSVGGAVGSIFFYIQKRQGVALQNLATEVKTIVRDEAIIRKQIRDDFSYFLNGKLELVIRQLETSLNDYEKYQKAQNAEDANLWKINMQHSYDNCHTHLDMGVNLLELMKIYGSIARLYWHVLGKLQFSSKWWYLNENDSQISDFAKNVKECLKNCQDLRSKILPLTPTFEELTRSSSQDSNPPNAEQKS